MATDKKITELPAATLPILGSGAKVELVQGGVNVQTDPDNIGGGTVPAKSFIVQVTDEVTPIAAGTSQRIFRMPYAMTLTSVRASLTSAQASGSIFTVDINEAASTILSTKLTIDNTATTSVGAATPAVISDAALADNAVITIDVDQIGNGSAVGLSVTFIGT